MALDGANESEGHEEHLVDPAKPEVCVPGEHAEHTGVRSLVVALPPEADSVSKTLEEEEENSLASSPETSLYPAAHSHAAEPSRL